MSNGTDREFAESNRAIDFGAEWLGSSPNRLGLDAKVRSVLTLRKSRLGSLNPSVILRAAASEPGRMHGLPSLAQNQGNERRAATGSAHGLCQIAFAAKPERAIQAI